MRENEAIIEARRAIDAARHGTPTVINIEGDAGFGKTRLLRALRAELADFSILRAFGEPDAEDVSGFLLDELIPSGSSPRMVNPLRAIRLLQEHVDVLQRTHPVAIVIDDLQWADAESVRALAGLVRRADGDRLVVIVACRPLRDTHPEWRRALSEARVLRLTCDGLDVAEVASLIDSHGESSDPTLAARLHAHTGGNPLYLTSLLREHAVADLESVRDQADLPAPLELAAAMRSRIDALSPDAARLLGALAVLGDEWVPLELAADVAGVTGSARAHTILVADELVRTRDRSVHLQTRIAHAVLRAAVYEVLDDSSRQRLHRAAAERVTDETARLRHRVVAARDRPDPHLLADIRAHATAQHSRGQFREAARSLHVAERTSAPVDERRRLRRDAEIEALLGRSPDAIRTRLEEADAHDRLVVSMSYANLGEWQQAWDTLSAVTTPEIDALPPIIAHRLYAVRAWAGHGCGRPADEVLAAVDSAGARDPDPALAGVLSFSRHHALTQTLDESSFWAVTGIGEDRTTLLAEPDGASRLAWRGMILAMNGMLPDAVSDLTVATGLVGDGALGFNDGLFHATLGLAQIIAGRMPRALASLDIARAAGSGVPHPMILAASRFRPFVGGDLKAARDDVEAARASLIRNRLLGGVYFADSADVFVLGLTGSKADQSEWMTRRRVDLGDARSLLRIRTPALWAACQGLAEGWGDEPEAAEVWASALAARATAPSWRTPMVRWLRARVAQATGSDETDTYAELTRSAFSGIPLLRALVARDAAASASAQRRVDAPVLARAAADLARPFTYLAGGDTAGPTSAGARSSAGGAEPFAVLSERERAVAALVVDGMSYAQIAKELFVTRSTVAFHLSNCYAKTNTSSRHELAQLARELRAGVRAQDAFTA